MKAWTALGARRKHATQVFARCPEAVAGQAGYRSRAWTQVSPRGCASSYLLQTSPYTMSLGQQDTLQLAMLLIMAISTAGFMK